MVIPTSFQTSVSTRPPTYNAPKTILDVLAAEGKIEKETARQLSSRLTSNAAVEAYVIGKRLVDPESTAKAYAVFFSLPFIHLKGRKIDRMTLERIPEKVAQDYLIIAYEEIGNTVKVAVANPSRLQSDTPGILTDLKETKGINIELSITTKDDIQHALKGYLQPLPRPLEEEKRIFVQPPKKELVPKISMPVLSENINKFVDLTKLAIPYKTLIKFPQEVADKYQIVVFGNPTPHLIKVAALHPEDPQITEIIQFIENRNHINVELYQADKEGIQHTLDGYRHPEQGVLPIAVPPPPPPPPKPIPQPKPKIVEPPKQPPEESKEEAAAHRLTQPAHPSDAENQDLDKFLNREVKTIEQLTAIVRTGYIPDIVAAVIVLASFKKASDIHIEAEETDLRLRYRVDGILQEALRMPLELQPPVVSRIKILAKLKIDEQRIPQDGRFGVLTGGHEVDLRIATLPTVHGEKVVIRLLDKSAGLLTLEQLGMTGINFERVVKNITKPFGIILATGPTGSGKSTTLYAILKRISTPAVNVVTLEDPVEYEIPGINQCQIRPKIGFSFAEGIRAVVRQDPNIIMVGEIRDVETASMATHAALTGHLVLSTLHTNDAAGALPRLTNMGVEPFLITSSINAIIAQRLVRKICPKCRIEDHPPQAVLDQVLKEISTLREKPVPPYRFYKGQGCVECTNGYRGRVGIYEVLPMTEGIENQAVAKAPASAILQQALKEGMVTMKQDGALKALKGLTTLNEVFRVTQVT